MRFVRHHLRRTPRLKSKAPCLLLFRQPWNTPVEPTASSNLRLETKLKVKQVQKMLSDQDCQNFPFSESLHSPRRLRRIKVGEQRETRDRRFCGCKKYGMVHDLVCDMVYGMARNYMVNLYFPHFPCLPCIKRTVRLSLRNIPKKRSAAVNRFW